MTLILRKNRCDLRTGGGVAINLQKRLEDQAPGFPKWF